MKDSRQTKRTETEQNNVETVLSLLTKGWGAKAGWQAEWRRCMVPQVQSYFHSQPPVEGIENAIAFNASLFEGFPKLELEIVSIVAEHEDVIVQGRLTGTHDGPFLNVPATGAFVDVPDVTMFKCADGRVTQMRYFTDLLAVMSAIGAVDMAA